MNGGVRAVAVFLSLAAGIALGAGTYRFTMRRARAAETAATSPTPTLAVSEAPPPASASAAIAPDAEAPSANESASTAPPPEDATKCITALFADGTFGGPIDLSEVCGDKTVDQTVRRMKEAVVRSSGGHVTTGMQEWASAGIHDMAIAAILRGRCCPTSPPLESPPSPGTCASVGDVLREIERAARADVPDSELDAVVAHFDSVARCIVRSGNTVPFGGYTSIDGGETTVFVKFLKRAQHGTAAR